ncbi:MerR family transcriptional regulator [Paenibacillus sp. NFR01]|uniref:MerR family transcriptional regulator n=1 Tax=Paenibacillus sp. NFR01 TaxID=1566279 RepID=UPI0008BECDA7|nr:MerR family transcriptional regulator [Paenibacillus sp. NFR01]SEU22946.1 DNA-binding transcriptional regulator, MerR family [Paenibacillus sp. NFR01]
MKYYSIGEAAALFRIPESRFRYYEKQGLLPLMERDAAGRRRFSEDQIALFGMVLCLKQTHMPISEIKQYIDWVVEGESTTELRLEMMQKHKAAVQEEMSLMTKALEGIDVKIARYMNARKNKNREEAKS